LIVFPSGRTGSYSIPDTVVGIGESAFYVCYGLTNVTIGSGIIDIGIKAFWECDGLVDVTFGSNIATIADWAFGRCDGLRSVTVGIGVTNCDPRAFAECPGLTNILVQNGNPSYSSLNGVLLDSSQTTLVTFPGGRAGSYTIPEAIETIEHNAFYGCALSGITIGNDVTSIGREAFFDSDNLTSVVISDSVSTIGYRAFGFCDNLDNVYFTGDAPANCNPAAFSGSPNVGVYYMPGTTGWSATFAGVSAYLWNPAFSGLAAHGSNVSCVVTGTPSIPVELESTTNLLAGSWVSLRTTNLTGGSVSLSDTNEITHPTRFYRIVGP
jgi:hypothetical protein